MSRPPDLTDRTALTRNRARARRAPALFLQRRRGGRDQGEARTRLTEGLRRRPWSPDFPSYGARCCPTRGSSRTTRCWRWRPGAHDLVIHALALHWSGDPVGQIVQCRRALRPDGLFLGVLFGGRTLAELRACSGPGRSRGSRAGCRPGCCRWPRSATSAALIQRAGLALPVADSTARTVSYRDVVHLMHDLRAMGEANALAHRRRTLTRRALFAEAAQLYAQAFPAPEGRISATFEMIFLSGWAPHDSQQKPLRPGSAVQRLADALGADERPLRDPAAGPATGPAAGRDWRRRLTPGQNPLCRAR